MTFSMLLHLCFFMKSELRAYPCSLLSYLCFVIDSACLNDAKLKYVFFISRVQFGYHKYVYTNHTVLYAEGLHACEFRT